MTSVAPASAAPPASNIDLPDFLQLVALSRKSSFVAVVGHAADGELYIESGELIHAQFGDLLGEFAVYAMLAEQTTYQVWPARQPPLRTVFLGTTNLLLEAARHQDEGSVPTPSTRPGVRTSDARSQPPAREISTISGAGGRRTRLWSHLGAGAGALLGLVFVVCWGFGFRIAQNVSAIGASASSSDVSTQRRETHTRSSNSTRALELHELGPDDHRPQLLERVRPKRPPTALAIEPTVIVRIRVDTEGQVAEARVYHPRNELAEFEAAGVEAVQRMRFVPAIVQGRPASVWLNWPVVFSRADAASETIRVKGSETIGGTLGPELARAYRAMSGVDVTFEALGSATAFVALFDGSADVGASSRTASDKELRRAKELGMELEEFVLGHDGVALVAHPANPTSRLTLEEAARLFSGQTTTWPSVSGLSPGTVRVYGRPSYSGTHALFKQKVLRKTEEGGSEPFAPGAIFLERNEDIVEAVATTPGAIGYVSLGFVNERVRVLALSAGPGRPYVEPTPETVRDGTYPMCRPLLFYTRGVPSARVSDFLRFALSDRGQDLVRTHGFIPTEASQSTLPSLNLAHEPGESSSPKVFHLSFRPASLQLTPEAEKLVPEVVAKVREGRRVILVGHADAIGRIDVNESISLARAKVIAEMLEHAGVQKQLLQVYGEDSSQPLSTNDTEVGRNLNRRVDLYLLPR